jgi:hypothetical protein
LGTTQGRSGSIPVQTGDLTIKADSRTKRNLLIIGGTAGAGAGTLGAYLAGNQEIVLPSETLLTFHVSSVTINPAELARLQSAAPAVPRNEPGYEVVESYPVFVERRRHHHDDEDDDDDEHEHHGEHHYRERYPEHINVFFISDHRAKVAIYWPERTEYVYLHGDDLDDILNPLSDRIHISVALIRPRIIVREHDDD